MQVITGNKTITYSVTPRGSFMRSIDVNGFRIIHATQDVGKFIGLMLCDDFARERARAQREHQLMKMISFWEMPTADSKGGSFDVELYNRVLAAKGVCHE